MVFPYGNKYGWGIGHYKKKKLLCNTFAEAGAFTVMMKLTNTQYKTSYREPKKYTREYIDNKYPYSDGGWDTDHTLHIKQTGCLQKNSQF